MAETLQEIQVSEIKPNPSHPRKTFKEDTIKGLAQTIKEYGLIHPVVVDTSYQIIVGERRWRAAKLASLEKIPVVVREGLTPTEKLEHQLIEDAQNESIPILERAEAWDKLKKERNLSNHELAGKLGVSKAYVGQMLRLVNLPRYMKEAFEQGKVSATDLMEIRSLPEEEQRAVLDEFIRRQKTREELRKMIRLKRNELLNSLRKSSTRFYGKALLKELGLDIDSVNMNKLVASNHETMKHFLVKAMIFKILREKGRTTGCEMEINGGVADLVDLDEAVVYEVETNPHPAKTKEKLALYSGSSIRDVFVIDASALPGSLGELEKWLRWKIA